MVAKVVELVPKKPMSEDDAWLRRQAVQIVAQLPADGPQARQILLLALTLLETFFSSPSPS